MGWSGNDDIVKLVHSGHFADKPTLIDLQGDIVSSVSGLVVEGRN